jgi:hypothetical protein
VSGPCGDDFTLKSLDSLNTLEQILDAIYHHGPVLGGGFACNPCWQYPGSQGCICYPVCNCYGGGGHAYMLYGYDDDYNPPIIYFQNSWGSGWGQAGRGRMGQAAYMQLGTPPDFYFTGGKDVRITIDLESTTVSRGDTLRVTATLENFSDQTQSFSAWCDVTLPNGNPYPGNPVAGPKSVTLQPFQQISRELKHYVPYMAPFGFYVYTGSVGVYPTEVFDTDESTFVIFSE